jgi:hypothetical protein
MAAHVYNLLQSGKYKRTRKGKIPKGAKDKAAEDFSVSPSTVGIAVKENQAMLATQSFCLTLRDDSMASAKPFPALCGAAVIFKTPVSKIRDNRYYVINRADGLIVRRAEITADGQIALWCDDGGHAPPTLVPTLTDQFGDAVALGEVSGTCYFC